MGVHVDDTAVGGFGKLFEDSIAQPKSRFPYRKWRVKSGEFCGAWYAQSTDGTIRTDMDSLPRKFAPSMRPGTMRQMNLWLMVKSKYCVL